MRHDHVPRQGRPLPEDLDGSDDPERSEGLGRQLVRLAIELARLAVAILRELG